jgi:hypothetical protein
MCSGDPVSGTNLSKLRRCLLVSIERHALELLLEAALEGETRSLGENGTYLSTNQAPALPFRLAF